MPKHAYDMMKSLNIINNKEVDEKDFWRIEKHYGYMLPENIKEFLRKCNGEITNTEYGIEIEFTTFSHGHMLSDGFRKVHHPTEILEQLQFVGFIEDFAEENGLSRKEIETEKLLPIMEVDGGSICIYVAIGGAHVNKLFVVDNGDFGISKVDFTFEELVCQ